MNVFRKPESNTIFFVGGEEGGSGRLVKQCKHDQNHKVMEKLSWDLRGTVMFDYCKISLG